MTNTLLCAPGEARISPFVMVFFLPIFFTYTGLRTNIGSLDSASGVGLVRA